MAAVIRGARFLPGTGRMFVLDSQGRPTGQPIPFVEVTIVPRVHPAELSDAGLAELLRTETDPERLRAAQRQALQRLAIHPLVGGGYAVPSRTTAGAHWLVDPTAAEGRRCTCPAEVATCWHQRQVASYCRLVDAMYARPTPPPNISALVD